MITAGIVYLLFGIALLAEIAVALACGQIIIGLIAAFWTTTPLWLRHAISAASAYERSQSERRCATRR